MQTCVGSETYWTGRAVRALASLALAFAMLACSGFLAPPASAAAQPRLASLAATFSATLHAAYAPSLAGVPQGLGYRPSPLAPVTVAPPARLLAAEGIMNGAGAASRCPPASTCAATVA